MLQLYRQHFCVKTVPYFMSYATYVSATIHARLASLKGMDSLAGKCLRDCLNVLAEQQTKCHAPRRTLRILKQLVRRLGLRVDNLPTEDCETSRGSEPGSGRYDATVALGSVPEGAHLSRVSEQPQGGVLVEDWMHHGNMTDFDSILLGVNMDDILRSFDVTFDNPVPTQAAGSRLDGEVVMDSMESPALEQGYQQDPGLTGFPVFSDPLFGFDFDIA